MLWIWLCVLDTCVVWMLICGLDTCALDICVLLTLLYTLDTCVLDTAVCFDAVVFWTQVCALVTFLLWTLVCF